MITWFDMPAEGLSPGSKAIIPTGNIELTENGEGIDVSEYATATVNVEGGGGSSDFSTAEVTVNWDPSVFGDELLKDNCPTIWRDDLDENSPFLQGYLYATTSPVVVEVPLYKGKCYWDLPNRGTIVTGNIEELDEGYLITGNGTITIS